MGDPYLRGILSEPLDLSAPPRGGRTYPVVAATIGMDVTHQATQLIGAVVECNEQVVTLRDDSGRDHRLRNTPGSFLVDGRPVRLTAPRAGAAQPSITASGSVSTGPTPARVARASRIMVEGIHDAELIERVWGDDLRSEGIVVEPLHGVDDLLEVVRAFGPRPGRRLGILVDHLVRGTKESQLANHVDHPDVAIRGHVFVDIWAAIDPQVLGLSAWPDIPKGQDWKRGVCQVAGFDEPAVLWATLLRGVTSYRQLDPSLVGAVESLIDFVTEPS